MAVITHACKRNAHSDGFAGAVKEGQQAAQSASQNAKGPLGNILYEGRRILENAAQNAQETAQSLRQDGPAIVENIARQSQQTAEQMFSQGRQGFEQAAKQVSLSQVHAAAFPSVAMLWGHLYNDTCDECVACVVLGPCLRNVCASVSCCGRHGKPVSYKLYDAQGQATAEAGMQQAQQTVSQNVGAASDTTVAPNAAAPKASASGGKCPRFLAHTRHHCMNQFLAVAILFQLKLRVCVSGAKQVTMPSVQASRWWWILLVAVERRLEGLPLRRQLLVFRARYACRPASRLMSTAPCLLCYAHHLQE